MSLSIEASQITKSQRWDKLYRILHVLFLNKEFIHVTDYTKMVTEMNARITIIETKLNTELQKIAMGLQTHVHPSPPAPVNPVITGIPAKPPYLVGFTPTDPVVLVRAAMDTYNTELIAQGPALAPLSTGSSPEELISNFTIFKDIGA